MPAPDPTHQHLWSWLAHQAQAAGLPLELRSRFSADLVAEAPVTLVLEGGEPMAKLSPSAKALFDKIDAEAVAARFTSSGSR